MSHRPASFHLTRLWLSILGLFLTAAPTFAYNFSISTLQGVTLTNATTLQFGPDHRLYVGQVNGQIKALTVQRAGPNNYQVTATETIDLIKNIPNYDDSGIRNFALTTRQVTGILVVGTAANPVIYVTSSDPRIGGGSGGENDLNLDTNSGIISRLTRSGGVWSKVDLVRGLPRSEENHASNGMQLDVATNILYLAQGGNTNAGGPSINFAYACETALSAAILSIDLNAINALPVKTDVYGQKYIYDLPTLDDPNPSRAHNADGSNANDPFGGNDGLNQAKLVPGAPVQIYAPGFRNPYDLVITHTAGREGRKYTFDNGANQGWGGYPMNEGPGGNVTNQYVEGEGGTVNNLDNLHYITGPGYYGGHPAPIRANPAGAGWFHFDNTLPAGSQKIYSTAPTLDWPPVPVSLANPVEGDFRQPGPTNGALLTNASSTNGLCEYVGTNFSGAMQGNLIAASYDGRLLRIALSPDGTAVTNGLEVLATGFGAIPLDVTAPDPGHGSAFVGTIWVAHYSPSKISILEPADFDSPGGSTCTGINSFEVDEDGDGFSNADEIANNSDPCSGAIRPADADGDHISDLLDQDDDNDGIPDTQDPFPLDAQNGKSVPMPVHYELFNDTGTGFYSVGLTGLMMNRGEDYLQRITPDNVIAGGTAGLFTIAQVGPGLALGAANSQKDAYQFAVNSDEFTSPFVVTSRLAGPFFANAPTGNQRQGIYVGTGDQDNYVWIALHANGGAGAIEVVYELGGTVVSQTMYPFSGLSSSSTVDFSFTIDPAAGTLQPAYRPEGGSLTPLGSPIHVTGGLLQSLMGSQPLAVGLFATTSNGSGPSFAATWDYFDVAAVASTAIAKVTVDPTGTNMATASTYNNGSFKIENLSTGGQQIQSVHIDLSTAMLPDLVYDPLGTAGDNVAKAFQANSASSGVVLASGGNSKPHNGVDGNDGYDQADATFTSFPVNGTFTFSIDIDPNNVKGVAQPGQGDSASVSGLELIGSTATVYFDDGSVQRTRLTRIENSVDGSYGWLRTDKPPKPGIFFPGKANPLKSGQAQETVRVTGPTGATVTLLTVESALYLGGVPGGGYHVQPFDSNTAIKITETSGIIPAGGYLDFSVTPTKTNSDAGYNVITAVLSDGANIKGPVSDALTLWYDPSFTGGDTQPPTAPGNLTATNVSSRSVTLSWSAATDNTNVQKYEVLRDGVLVSSTLGLTYTDIGLDGGVTYNYSVVARDDAGNPSTAATVNATTTSNGTVVLRVNGGGPSFVDSKGNTWAADSGFNTGTVTTTTNAIDRAVDDTLFKTDRIDSATAAPDLAYAFNVANGTYEVQLFMAELSTTNAAVGKRVFDVVIENQLAFDNLDIFALAGAPYTAVVVYATTTVTDGQLNIAFVRGVGNPKVNAIKLIKLPPAETNPPSTPGNFNATNVTSNSVTLAWDASTDDTGVAGYIVTRNGSALPATTSTSLTDTGLSGSTQYQYTVRAFDAAGNNSASASLSVTTLTPTADSEPPTAPGALTFTGVSSTSITVNWTASADNIGVTGYQVSRNGTALGTITALKYVDTNLTPGTTYNYSVVALDASNNVSPASTGSSTTLSGPSLSTIRVNTGGSTYVDSSGNTWSADIGFNTGTAKTYADTLSIGGTTEPTLFRSERYDVSTAPELAYSFNVTNGNYLVRLYFAETYASTSAIGKRVFDIDIQGTRAFNDVDIFVLAGGANKALVLEKGVTVTGGQLNIGFLHQVENPKINAIEIIPAGSGAPTAPGALTFSNVTASSVTINWTAATDDVGVTGYRVSRNGVVVGTPSGLSFTDTGLTSGTSYSYSVVALDADNNASASSTASVVTAGPGSATTVRINAGGSDYVDSSGHTWAADFGFNTGKISTTSNTVTGTSMPDLFKSDRYDESPLPKLTYTLPIPNGTYLVRLYFAETYSGTSAAGKRVFDIDIQGARAYEDFDIFVAAGGANKAYILERPATVTNGQLTVMFSNQTQNPKVNAIEVVPTDSQAPTAPTGLTSSNITYDSVKLSWNASSDNIGVTGYEVSRDGILITTVSTPSFTDSNLSPTTNYTYSVVAVDAASNGSTPAQISVTTLAAPDTQAPTKPGTLTFSSVNSTSVTLTWGASTDNVGVSGYQVSRDGVLLDTVTNTTFTDSSLSPATTYAYSIVAVDAASNASTATTGSVTTLTPSDTQAPSAPGSLVFSNVTSNSVTVSWAAATDNVGVTGYQVSRNGSLITTTTALSVIDSPLAAGTSYSYSVVAVDAAANTSTASTGTVATATGIPPPNVIRVNAGGPSYVDSASNTWSADTGFYGGTTTTSSATVTNTTDPTLFKTERYTASTTTPFSYTFSVPNGTYLVRLHFAETYSGTKGIGKRVFDIDINSVRAFEDVDIFKLAGGGDKATKLEKSVTVTGGKIKVSFIHQTQNPKVNAIEVIPTP